MEAFTFISFEQNHANNLDKARSILEIRLARSAFLPDMNSWVSSANYDRIIRRIGIGT